MPPCRQRGYQEQRVGLKALGEKAGVGLGHTKEEGLGDEREDHEDTRGNER